MNPSLNACRQLEHIQHMQAVSMIIMICLYISVLLLFWCAKLQEQDCSWLTIWHFRVVNNFECVDPPPLGYRRQAFCISKLLKQDDLIVTATKRQQIFHICLKQSIFDSAVCSGPSVVQLLLHTCSVDARVIPTCPLRRLRLEVQLAFTPCWKILHFLR